MNIFVKLFGDKEESSANKARERLKLVLAHERTSTNFPFMDDLRRDMIEVLQKYLKVEDINIKTENGHSKELNIDLLEVEVSVGKNVKKNNKNRKANS